MRIIAGKFKGISLLGPTDKKIRPLKDMVRESIFNLLSHSNKILFQLDNSNILDLYSGTGSFGLECISRQAKKVIFVEKEREAIKILEKNIEKLKVKSKTKILTSDVIDIIKKQKNYIFNWLDDSKLDLIFFDPPFKDLEINILIEQIIKNNFLNKNGIIILHRHKNTKEKLTRCIEIIDERVYGLSKIIIGKSSNFLS